MSSINFEDLQNNAHCNWCRNPMVMSEPLTEANLVDTGRKYPALYCSACLALPERVKQPKGCINLDTYDEYNIEDLPDVVEEKEEEVNKSGDEAGTTI